MRWHDLLFLHSPVHPEVIRPLIPSVFELDVFDGWCWIGVVPFRMSGVRPRYMPTPLAFPELNVRTYVKMPDEAVFGFSAWTQRVGLRLKRALAGATLLQCANDNGVGRRNRPIQSVRVHTGAAPAEFSASYHPTGPVYRAASGTLDHWLTERYCLYAAIKLDQIVYGKTTSAMPVKCADVELRTNTMTHAVGIQLPDTKPICHFARHQEVVAWPIVPIEHMNRGA